MPRSADPNVMTPPAGRTSHRLGRSAVPLTTAFLVFAAFMAFTSVRSRHVTDGHLTYALDDAYIHMSIARNLALHGTWGIEPDAFSSASSSPLWTLLLALGFRLGGVHDALPLALNLIFAVLVIGVAWTVLRRQAASGQALSAVLVALVLATPLVPMVWLGMEHTLHILLTLMAASALLAVVESGGTRRVSWLCVLTALMVATRYEGLFVAAGCAVALVAAHRRVAAALLCASAALPVVAMGAWNVRHGWFFLPTSILMKQTVLPGEGRSVLGALTASVAGARPPAIFLLLLLGAMVLLTIDARRRRTAHLHPLLLVFVTAAVLHTMLAKFGWLFRYESYLMALGVVAIAAAIVDSRRSAGRLGAAVAGYSAIVVVAGSLLFADRTIASHAVTANTTGHIYRQHRQVAALLERNIHGDKVAVNDIGVISYYGGVRVYDLIGLASLEVAEARRAGRWQAADINAWLDRNQVTTAIVYDTWFEGNRAFYREWRRVGEWTTDEEDSRGEGTVSFFARSGTSANRLADALRRFAVPAGVGRRLAATAP